MTNEEILKKHARKEYFKELEWECLLSALEEAREDERKKMLKEQDIVMGPLGPTYSPKILMNQGRGEGPVWVKAENELPEKSGWYFIKNGALKDKLLWTRSKLIARHQNGATEIEWLKEPDKLEQSKKEQ